MHPRQAAHMAVLRRASRKGACTPRRQTPFGASPGAAPPREGSVQLRRTTHQCVCRRAPPRKESVRLRQAKALRGLAWRAPPKGRRAPKARAPAPSESLAPREAER